MIVIYSIVTVTALFGWLSLTPRFRTRAASPRLQRGQPTDGTICRKLARDLASASSVAAAWDILRSGGRALGFSYVELTLHPLTSGAGEGFPRYAERLRPAPRSDEPPETTFAIGFVARNARGQVVFSRAANLRPHDPEVPLLINAVAESMPRVIERSAGAETSRDPSQHREGRTHFETPHRRSTTICRSCGSPRVFRSRTRSTLEQCRKTWTSKRPYVCLSCGWRAWQEPHLVAPRAANPTVHPPDLRGLDLAFQNSHTPDQPRQ